MTRIRAAISPPAGLCVAAVALISLSLAATSAAAQRSALPVEEVAPGTFVFQGAYGQIGPDNLGAIANMGFVIGTRGVAVIDTGGSRAAGEGLLAAIRERTGLPVLYVLNTHMHPDHILGDPAFPNATVIGHAKLKRALHARGSYYIETSAVLLGDTLAAGLEIVMPDEGVADERIIDLGDRPLRLTAWPTAHTDNDLTVLDEATGTLFAGDLVFAEHLPALDGSLTGWIAVGDALAAIPAERVVPGHGPASMPWPEAIAPQRAYLTSLAEQLRDLISRGIGLPEAVEIIAPPRGWQEVDEFHQRNVTTGYAELEWE